MKLTDCYRIGDTVLETPTDERGVVILVTNKKVLVKFRYSTTTYSEIGDISNFKDELKVLGNINYTLRYTEQS